MELRKEADAVLEAERVWLRAVDEKDAERVQRWLHEAAAGLWPGGVPGVLSRRAQELWLQQAGAGRDPSVRVFAVDTSDGRHIGLAQVYAIDWVHRRGRLALLLGEPDYRGRGFEEEALRGLLAFAFHRLNLNRLEAWLPASAGAEVQAFARAGFTQEARLAEYLFAGGRYDDAVVLRVLARDFTGGP